MRSIIVGIGLLALALGAVSCSTDRAIGERYRAERDLWRLDWEFRNLSIRPQDVAESQWTDLATRYEGIAERFRQPEAAEAGEVHKQIQTIAARALFAAARIHANLQDSLRVSELFAQMSEEFDHLPEVFGEVELARGNIAESQGQLAEAAAHYQHVVARIAPEPGAASAAGMVLDLPLRIARLQARADMDARQVGSGDAAPAAAEVPATYHEVARAYYEQLAREHPDDLIGAQSQARLADVAADLGDWDQALESLRRLESLLLTLQEPPREPCTVRFAIAGLQRRAGTDPAEVARTLNSVLADYPDCEAKPQVLMALAESAAAQDQVEEALGHLDAIVEQYDDDPELASQALLNRGQLLESRERWAEALEVYRALPSRYPLTSAALQAPLRIAQHYQRNNEEESMRSALSRAERHYRDFVTSYPPGPLTVFARERLIETLLGQERYDDAIEESIRLGDDLAGSQEGVSHLIAAAGIARNALADSIRAAEILDHVAEVYSQASVGEWAGSEAARIRGSASQ